MQVFSKNILTKVIEWGRRERNEKEITKVISFNLIRNNKPTINTQTLVLL